jgi:LacI family transcriptional regulator
MADVTLKKLAEIAGVHPSTASRALDPRREHLVNDATLTRIRELADSMGYHPDLVARSLKQGRTGTVGVIVADLGNQFVTPIIHGLAGALDDDHVLPIIAETEDDHDRFDWILANMLSRRVDAIITSAARYGDVAMLEKAGRLVPLIIAARSLPETTLPQVVHDDLAGGRTAAEHLIDLGHRRIAQLRGPDDVGNFANRAIGFTAACIEHGIEEVVVEEIGMRPVRSEGRRLMAALLGSSDDRPTAIFAHNDLMAFGALDVLREAGLNVPGDVSLMGYNDTPLLSRVEPPLTSVRYPSHEVGQESGALALQMIADPDLQPEPQIFGVELVRRASTAPLGR